MSEHKVTETATILLVEDHPDLSMFEAGILEAEGHTVYRCGGSPVPCGDCPVLKGDPCSLADAADVLIISTGMIGPVGPASRVGAPTGQMLVEAYRAHDRYGWLPTLVVSATRPTVEEGIGPFVWIPKHSAPEAIVGVVHDLIASREAIGPRS